MEIKKILFVTKFHDLCFDALRSLLPLRKAALEHVVFVNVIEREKVAMKRGAGYQKDEERRLRETANIRFIDWAEQLFEEGMEVGVYIVVGGMVPQVIIAEEKERADLIVVGQSQKGLFEMFYSGSDVAELLRRSTAPVLVYKHSVEPSKPAAMPFDRPLLAIDWSPASLNAVRLLKKLTGVIQEVNVIHVAGEDELKGSSAMEIQKTRKKYRTQLDAVCEEFEAAQIPARPHVYVGDPAQEIEKAARECMATMIVMGSSGKSAWVERWLGSVPRTIAEKSAHSTLLIPPG